MPLGEPLSAAPGGGALPTGAPPSGVRRWVSERQGRIGLGGLLLLGAVISSSASRTHLLLPQSLSLAIPSSLAGPFGYHGIDLGYAGVAVTLALMLVSYALAIRACNQLSARSVLLGIAALNAVVLLAPPLLSTDVFSYIAYGRLGAVYHANPYIFGPEAIPVDKLYSLVGAQWVTTPSAYGPLFTAISYVLTPLTIAGNVIAYKLIAAGSSVVIVVVVWNTARLRGLDPVKAVALVGLNPVTVVFGVGGGHNDMLMLAIMLTGVYVLLRQKERTSGALLLAATAVKLTAGLLLPFALARHGGRGEDSRSRRAVFTGFAVAAVLGFGLSFGLFGTGPLRVLGTLTTVQTQGGLHSISGLLLAIFGLSSLGAPVSIVLDVAFVIYSAWLLWRVWNGKLDWITGAGWATVGLLLTAGLLLPWYVAWLVPLVALSSDRRLLGATIALTGLGLTTL